MLAPLVPCSPLHVQQTLSILVPIGKIMRGVCLPLRRRSLEDYAVEDYSSYHMMQPLRDKQYYEHDSDFYPVVKAEAEEIRSGEISHSILRTATRNNRFLV